MKVIVHLHGGTFNGREVSISINPHLPTRPPITMLTEAPQPSTPFVILPDAMSRVRVEMYYPDQISPDDYYFRA